MHTSNESHIEALLDGFEKVHHQVVSDVVAAEGEIVFVVCPTAFHQFGLEPFFFEQSCLIRVVDRRLAG